MTLPDPNTKIRYRTNNVFGSAVYMGRRTAAHLDWTREESQKAFGRDLTIIQGAYNTGVAASAGTHDFDRALDVVISGVDMRNQEHFFRAHGWAAWYRYPPSFSTHIHMITLGGSGPVGIYIPGQISDYYAHRSGLIGHVADNAWHPDHIDATIFDYPKYMKEDDAMTETEHKALMEILGLLRRSVPNAAERDQKDADRDKHELERDQASAAQGRSLAAAVDRGFEDLARELNSSSADVKAKVNSARETIVGALRKTEEHA